MGKISYFGAMTIALVFATSAFGAVGTLAQPEKSAAPVALQRMQNQFCRALAPTGWNIVDQDDHGATFSLASPSHNIVAAYGVASINGGQVAGLYGPQYRTPALFAQYLASTIMGGQALTVTAIRPFNGMQVMNFAAGKGRGFAIYRVFPLPSDPEGYVISVRIAIGGGISDVSTAGAVAASIDCKTAFKAPQGGYAEVHAKSAETGISQRCKSGDCNDADLAGTYNMQLGTGYVHSASGTNYLVNPSTDYRDTGPDGPGYYRQAGNTMEKLLPGRSD